MNQSDIEIIKNNRRKIEDIFLPIESALSYATEENLDTHVSLINKFKRILVVCSGPTYNCYKLNSMNKPCNPPALSQKEKNAVRNYPDLFFYLRFLILKNEPEMINKKYVKGFYFKYKDSYFTAFSSEDVNGEQFLITSVKQIRSRHPVEITPYDILRNGGKCFDNSIH